MEVCDFVVEGERGRQAGVRHLDDLRFLVRIVAQHKTQQQPRHHLQTLKRYNLSFVAIEHVSYKPTMFTGSEIMMQHMWYLVKCAD